MSLTVKLRYVMLMLGSGSCYKYTGGQVLEVLDYTTETATDYLYQTNLPAFSQMTVCYRMKATRLWHPYSISTNAYDNSFLPDMGNWPSLNLVIKHTATYLELPESVSEQGDEYWSNWHVYCTVWEANNEIRFYTDVEGDGALQMVASVSTQSQPVESGGILVVGHDQDSTPDRGIVVSTADMTRGKYAWFNVWDRAMTDAEITSMPCTTYGNVVNWATLKRKGNLVFERHFFPSPAGPNHRTKKVEGRVRQMYLYYRPGCRLSSASLQTSEPTLPSITLCLSSCNRNPECYSITYNRNTGECNLHDIAATGADNSLDCSVESHVVYVG